MANKKKVTDAQVAAADEIFKAGQKVNEVKIAELEQKIEIVREETRNITIIEKIDYDIVHNKLLKIMVLYRIKQAKDYKKRGMTWAQFCDAVGTPQRTVDLLIQELQPLFKEFSAKLANLAGCDFNKIRYLGKALSSESAKLAEIEDNALVFEGEKIPLTPEHKDDIEAVIDKIKDRLKQKDEELKAQKKAFDRVSEDHRKSITSMEKELSKLEKSAKEKKLTPVEDAYLQRISNIRLGFDGYMLRVDPERMDDLKRDNDPTTRMRAAYIEALGYMKKQILVAYDAAVETYGNAIMMPEEGWKPKATEGGKKN